MNAGIRTFLLNIQPHPLRCQHMCRGVPNKRCEPLNCPLLLKEHSFKTSPRSFLTIAFCIPNCSQPFQFHSIELAGKCQTAQNSWHGRTRLLRSGNAYKWKHDEARPVRFPNCFKVFRVYYDWRRLAVAASGKERIMGFATKVWCNLQMAVLDVLSSYYSRSISKYCSWMKNNGLLLKTCFKTNVRIPNWSTELVSK